MKRSRTLNKSLTDWVRLDAQSDEDIDLSDIPEITPEMFARAVVRRGLKPIPSKAQVTLRLDRDVLSWFKTQGRGYQTRINSLLRAYMEAHGSQHSKTNLRERKIHAARKQNARGLSATPRR
ncbi:MAG: BrnA antitoxin family protein [Chloroflexi bacterium]|nr:BrnA antitoxin family protein [Chloroflexota bacterium]